MQIRPEFIDIYVSKVFGRGKNVFVSTFTVNYGQKNIINKHNIEDEVFFLTG